MEVVRVADVKFTVLYLKILWKVGFKRQIFSGKRYSISQKGANSAGMQTSASFRNPVPYRANGWHLLQPVVSKCAFWV